MRIILGLLIILTLLVFGSAGVFGATHPMGDRIVTDTWYDVTPETPYWQLFYNNTPDFHLNASGGEFYQNDHTFIWVQASGIGHSDLLGLSGSYLFKNGFFIGLYYFESPTYHRTTLSPGYRLSFDEHSYLALSMDYQSSSNTDEIMGYDLDLCYYIENAKLSGEIYIPRTGDTSIDFGITFALTEALTVGLDYTHLDKIFSTGFTYTTAPVIVDFTYLNDDEDDYSSYKISGMFNIGAHYGVGITGQKDDDIRDPKYTLKFRYTNNHTKIKLFYTPEVGSGYLSYGMVWYASF